MKSQSKSLHNHRILVVDDDYAILSMYAMKLSREGYIVETAQNGLQGLNKAKEFMPDLILLDLKMPEMTGEEMLRELRKSEWGSDIKVIILSNVSKEESTHGFFLLGIKRYILKASYTPAQIVKIVEEVLR